jgi:hypothetical protein
MRSSDDVLGWHNLERKREIDPANMTYPQLMLFQIRLRRGERGLAGSELEDFLARHPDRPEAGRCARPLRGFGRSLGGNRL